MFSSHYLFEPDFCSPAKGNEKGRVENIVGVIKHNFFTPLARFKSLEELNERLLSFVISYCRNREHPTIAGKTRYDVYEAEKNVLVELPQYGFDCCSTTISNVSKCSMVLFDNNRYSVPIAYIGKGVLVKGFANEVIISYGGSVIGRHPRSFARKKELFNPYHYIAALQRKPGAIRNGKPFKNWDLPEVFLLYRRLLNEKYPEDGDVYFARTLVLLKDWPIKEVTDAISKAVERGILGDSYILAILRYGKDPPLTDTELQVRSDLAQYSAKQRPPDEYDRILRKRELKEELTNERK